MLVIRRLWLQLSARPPSVVMGPGSRCACPGRRGWIQLSNSHSVIARSVRSEAIQRKERLDCGACHRARIRATRWLTLAMTSNFQLRPRAIIPARQLPPSRCKNRPSDKQRAQGMPGAQPHPQPRMRNKKAYERGHHRFAETARHSLHDGVTAYFVLSPVNRAFCHRRLSIISTSLTPASGRQDHTTSPSASRHHSSADASCSHRIPRPTSVTIAIRPSCGCGTGQGRKGDLPDGARIFWERAQEK
jgi:hypothetical protein